MDERSNATDAALVARVNAGDRECFGELVRRYSPALARVARSRLGRADWADDVVQETFLSAFRSCATYDPRYSFRTWLWTILLNQCKSHFLRRMRRVPVEPLANCDEAGAVADNGRQSDDSPLARLLAAERSATLEQLLSRISSVQADALRLRFFGGLKFQEIAETMQCSLNTAKHRVREGLVRMASLIESADADPTTGPRRGRSN
jgi:RNA polymerase sigma-70 factor (ECF subfamily)